MAVEQLSKYFMPGFEVWGRVIIYGDWGPEEVYTKLGDIEGLMENQSGTERNIADREVNFASDVFYCLSESWFELVTVIKDTTGDGFGDEPFTGGGSGAYISGQSNTGGTLEIKNANGEVYDVVNQEDVQGRNRVMQVDCIIRR